MRNNNRVDPGIKMADVKPETLVSRFADLSYLLSTNFQPPSPHFLSAATRCMVQIRLLPNVGVAGISKMVTTDRKYMNNDVNISLYT